MGDRRLGTPQGDRACALGHRGPDRAWRVGASRSKRIVHRVSAWPTAKARSVLGTLDRIGCARNGQQHPARSRPHHSKRNGKMLTDAQANAVAAVANTTGKAVDASRGIGGFLTDTV